MYIFNQHNIREVLMMDTVIPETCWAYKKCNKIISGHLVGFYSSDTAFRVYVSFNCYWLYPITSPSRFVPSSLSSVRHWIWQTEFQALLAVTSVLLYKLTSGKTGNIYSSVWKNFDRRLWSELVQTTLEW